MSTRVDFYTQWRDLMRSWGFTVHEAAGWRTRDAEPRTAYDPSQLYLEHHDASTHLSGNWGALAYILANNLANIVTARDGQIMLCAAGVQWHAGVGAWPGIPTNGANPKSLGNEVCNSGNEAYPAAQSRAIIAGEAAWAIVSKRNADRVLGHKEWAKPVGRKVDPTVDMNQRRRDVTAAMNAPTLADVEDFLSELAPTEQRRLYNMIMDAFWDGVSGSAFREKAQVSKTLDRIEAKLKQITGDDSDGDDRQADQWKLSLQILAAVVDDPKVDFNVDDLVDQLADGLGENLAGQVVEKLGAKLAAA